MASMLIFSSIICVMFHNDVHGTVLYIYDVILEGTLIGDDTVAPLLHFPASEGFRYYGSNITDFYISTNGIISFGSGLHTFSNQSFPLNDSIPKIAPFWADIDTTDTGVIYYRKLPFLSKLLIHAISGDIEAAFPDEEFHAEYALIVTWQSVTFKGGSLSTPSNTFQAVIVTDGNRTFAIFNYETLTWTNDPGSGGDANGLGGIQAQVGFDRGDGINFYAVNGSQTAEVINLTSTSNSATTGRWIFQIDSLQIKTGTVAQQTTDGAVTDPPIYNVTALKSTEAEDSLTTGEIALITVAAVGSLSLIGAVSGQIYKMHSQSKMSVEPQQADQRDKTEDQSDDSDDEKKKKKKRNKKNDKSKNKKDKKNSDNKNKKDKKSDSKKDKSNQKNKSSDGKKGKGKGKGK